MATTCLTMIDLVFCCVCPRVWLGVVPAPGGRAPAGSVPGALQRAPGADTPQEAGAQICCLKKSWDTRPGLLSSCFCAYHTVTNTIPDPKHVKKTSYTHLTSSDPCDFGEYLKKNEITLFPGGFCCYRDEM